MSFVQNSFRWILHVCYLEQDMIKQFQCGDTLVLKKNHPCGGARFVVLRSGMVFKLLCEKCGHEVEVPRSKAEKNIKQIIREEQNVR